MKRATKAPRRDYSELEVGLGRFVEVLETTADSTERISALVNSPEFKRFQVLTANPVNLSKRFRQLTAQDVATLFSVFQGLAALGPKMTQFAGLKPADQKATIARFRRLADTLNQLKRKVREG